MFLHILPFIVKLLSMVLLFKAELETASLFLDPPVSDRKGNKSSVNSSHE